MELRNSRGVLAQVMFAAALLVSVLATPLSSAATSTVGPVVISVPAGFSEAGSQQQGGMQVAAWTKPNGPVKTLLQVSIYDFGSQLDKKPSPQDLTAGSEKYLRDFLGGIERRRTDYQLSPVEHMKLAGLPASRATWKGRAGDIASVGVMYCVIVQGRFVVSFHTQDAGSSPTDAMREAMKSIETAKIS